ncbi:MAG: DNA-3-methyladenine glycosylase I [SAR324 cluster bacterium]|nr:DNA-3-methyladenine glycosylase I [SAR324 cluster bacterium]
MIEKKIRCGWCGQEPLYVNYHDMEWGVPTHDDQKLFEMLILEGQQAGLSWITVLKKREHYRMALDNFNPQKMASYDDQKRNELMQNSGIIRNRLKILSFTKNAQGFLNIQEEFGSFDSYLWEFVEGKAIQNAWQSLADIPGKTPLAEKLSVNLKKRGFSFIGPTICYAFMQSVGMVNDHLVDCFRYSELANL